MTRRKGTPCACECDPCGSKKCIKAINNVSGDPNGDFEIVAGIGIGISQSSDNSITIVNQGDPNAFIAGDNIEINPAGDNLEIRVTDDVFNPNKLVNNVNDWLNVDLSNKDGNANRTTVLNHEVTTNVPQQSGESIYCYFGTRYVFWQASGFVTVFVVGQGNDSNAHIWINNFNNFNNNVGDWIGWKRVF